MNKTEPCPICKSEYPEHSVRAQMKRKDDTIKNLKAWVAELNLELEVATECK